MWGVPVAQSDIANTFARHFSDKIKLNHRKAMVDLNGVYNGKCKLIVQNRHFMTSKDVKECMVDLKNKKCEGFDRIPLCLIVDAGEILSIM